MATDRRIALEFTAWTFGIAAVVSGALIVAGRYGYAVHNWVGTPQQLLENLPFSIYILSPAIASYGVLRYRGRVSGPREWLATVFHVRTSPVVYAYVLLVLAMYFLAHIVVSGPSPSTLPLYTLLLSIPGNLIIGGLEESGWAYILQPQLDSKLGYMVSSLLTSFIWLGWHVPLFFIPGTNHSSGFINFWMFAVQIVAFRFFYGAICRIAGRANVFMCVFAHTLFNAGSATFGIPPTTWAGTVTANACVLALAIAAVVVNACWTTKRRRRYEKI